MRIHNSFRNRQYQLTCFDDVDRYKSLKNKKFKDLFLKKMSYNPMLFRNNGRYSIENRQWIREQIKLLKDC